MKVNELMVNDDRMEDGDIIQLKYYLVDNVGVESKQIRYERQREKYSLEMKSEHVFMGENEEYIRIQVMDVSGNRVIGTGMTKYRLGEKKETVILSREERMVGEVEIETN